MKKLKLLTTVCLITAMLVSSCSMALAASVSELGINWIFNPVKDVKGYIYSATPHGFIISNPELYTQAFVTEKETLIDGVNKYFSSVGDDGLVVYYDTEAEGRGIMDLNGKVIVKPATYDDIVGLDGKLFAYAKYSEEEGTTYYGVKDSTTKTIIPAKYHDIKAWGVIVCYNYNDGKYDVYRRDGKLIGSYVADDILRIVLLPNTDKFIVSYYNEITNHVSSYITIDDGCTIAIIERELAYYTDDKLFCGEWTNDGYKTYYYDYTGKLLETRDDEDPYDMKDPMEETQKYRKDPDDERNVIDQKGKLIYRAPRDCRVDKIYNNSIVKVCQLQGGYFGLYDFSGREIAPLIYDDIKYSEGLDAYAFRKNRDISIGKISPVKVTVNGKKVSFDQNPVVKEGRTLVPLRAIFEALGAEITWDGATQTVRATLGSTKVKLVVGSKDMKVNDKIIKIDVPAEIINGRTMVPARAVGEALNCSVKWDEASRTVIIKK